MGLTPDQKVELSKLYAAKFISRPDVIAVQKSNGIYVPDTERKFNMARLHEHLEGSHTYGHYLLGKDSTVKFICFDLDLREADAKKGIYYKMPKSKDEYEVWTDYQPGDPRSLWRSRVQGVEREFLKYQMRRITHVIASAALKLLDFPVAVTYTGSKGMHVYVLTGKIPAADARYGAKLVLDHVGGWAPDRAFYSYNASADLADDPEENFEQFTLEVFPKQDKLEEGKPLGNLIRLPLGVNLKAPKDPTFFVDLKEPWSVLRPTDPIQALTTSNPWR